MPYSKQCSKCGGAAEVHDIVCLHCGASPMVEPGPPCAALVLIVIALASAGAAGCAFILAASEASVRHVAATYAEALLTFAILSAIGATMLSRRK